MSFSHEKQYVYIPSFMTWIKVFELSSTKITPDVFTICSLLFLLFHTNFKGHSTKKAFLFDLI